MLFTPDTPNASEHHDSAVVDNLDRAAAVAADDADGEGGTVPVVEFAKLLKRTKGGIAKLKVKYAAGDRSNGSGQEQRGASSLEGATSAEFFLDLDHPKWGDAPKFDSQNMGRMNLWTTSMNSIKFLA